jgi:hypothetical protein
MVINESRGLVERSRRSEGIALLVIGGIGALVALLVAAALAMGGPSARPGSASIALGVAIALVLPGILRMQGARGLYDRRHRELELGPDAIEEVAVLPSGRSTLRSIPRASVRSASVDARYLNLRTGLLKNQRIDVACFNRPEVIALSEAIVRAGAAPSVPGTTVQVPLSGSASIPKATTTDHAGRALSATADVFAGPPDELGGIRSSDTTLERGALLLGPRVSLGLALLPAVAGLVVGSFGPLTGRSSDAGMLGVMGLLGSWAAWRKLRVRPECSYVGQRGVCRYTLLGSRDEVTSEVLLFESAEALRSSSTVVIVNGAYKQTNFRSEWRNAGGETLFLLQGGFRDPNREQKHKAGLRPKVRLNEFAAAAEDAWYAAIQERVVRQLQSDGAVAFAIGKSDRAVVGKDFVEIASKGGSQRWEAADVAVAQAKQGTVEIRRRDARKTGLLGLGKEEGVYTCEWGTIDNARVFLAMVERLAAMAHRG